MKSFQKIGIIAGGILIAGALTWTGVTAADLSTDNTTIPEHVTIGGVDVAGMDESQAMEAVADHITALSTTEISLNAGEKSVTVTAGDMGISADAQAAAHKAIRYGSSGNLLERFRDRQDIKEGKTKDFPIVYTIDRSMTENLLESKAEELSQEAVDNGLKRENGEFIFIEGKEGITVDIAPSVVAIESYVAGSFESGSGQIELATIVEEPQGNEEDLKSIKDVLGSYVTDFSSSSAARANNVRNGASLINDTMLYPGETFSVAKALNPMTAENGYQQAPSYENGTTVMTYGGGICQVSTTLYNAVIRAELEVVERSSHSMIVTYVKPSEDAAIAGDSKDFKFKNNQDTPIYIEGYTNGGKIYFNIYGKETRPANRTVEFESEVLAKTEPKNVFHADGGTAIGSVVKTSGSAHTGYKARLWKIVKEDGKEVSREVFNNSSYRVTNNEYSVGTKSDSADAVAAIKAAIASGDLSTIQSAASKWSASAVKEREEKENQEKENKEKETQEEEPEEEDEDDSEE